MYKLLACSSRLHSPFKILSFYTECFEHVTIRVYPPRAYNVAPLVHLQHVVPAAGQAKQPALPLHKRLSSFACTRPSFPEDTGNNRVYLKIAVVTESIKILQGILECVSLPPADLMILKAQHPNARLSERAACATKHLNNGSRPRTFISMSMPEI